MGVSMLLNNWWVIWTDSSTATWIPHIRAEVVSVIHATPPWDHQQERRHNRETKTRTTSYESHSIILQVKSRPLSIIIIVYNMIKLVFEQRCMPQIEHEQLHREHVTLQEQLSNQSEELHYLRHQIRLIMKTQVYIDWRNKQVHT